MSNQREKLLYPAAVSSYALYFIVLCLVVYILNLAQAILIPFVIAVFVWYLINAMARGFSRFNLSRIISFSLAILILGTGVFEISELIGRNVTAVAKAAPEYQAHFMALLPRAMEMLSPDHQPTIEDMMSHIDIAAIITLIVKAVSGLAGKTVVVVFYTGFLLYEQQFFDRKISGIFTDKGTEKDVRHILHNIDIKVQRYIWVKTFVSALAGILTFVIMKIFGIGYAGFWGAVTFLLNFIPYIGSMLSIVLPSLVALVQFEELAPFVLVLTSLAVLHGLIGHGLDPYLMGQNLNLSPIFIISSLAMWGMIWGVPGMFLSIPILAMIVITLSQFPSTRPLAILLSKDGMVNHELPSLKRK